MKVLIACEYSGRVRDAFIKKGHNAISCDLLPTDSTGPHYQGDVFDIIDDGFDMMIAHPPCTYLSSAGIGWFNEERYGEKARERKRLREEALIFFKKLYDSNIKKICIENPTGYVNTHFRKPDQTIHPYYFGDPVLKRTNLWLKRLPLLLYPPPTSPPPPIYVDSNGKNRHFVDSKGKTKNRWKIRSTTFQGIANAMADQWG